MADTTTPPVDFGAHQGIIAVVAPASYAAFRPSINIDRNGSTWRDRNVSRQRDHRGSALSAIDLVSVMLAGAIIF